MTTANVAILATIISVTIGSLIALQTFWISRSLDAIVHRLDRFEDRMHADLQVHTEAIADLRERRDAP